MNVIVIGNGGREHTISWKLAQSSKVEKVVCVPGNGGTAKESKCINIDLSSCSYLKDDGTNPYIQIAKHEECTLAVIGPEDPLADGLADIFWQAGIPCVGPKKAAAQLEASKDVAKTFMQKYGVACAESKTFTDAKLAHEYVAQKGAPIVIKADGLAAGKGVVVALTEQEAQDAITSFMEDGKLGEAGKSLVIEEYLSGVEISILSAVSVAPNDKCGGTYGDNVTIVPFVTARDHKRLLDGAKGPNTGGMGAIAPVKDVTPEQLADFEKNILQPTLKGMIAEKMDYRGFIFFGIMLTKNGPKLLEYNVRLGDPETQAVLPLMDFDFEDMCLAIINGTLKDFEFKWKEGYSCAPVAVSGGYPEAYKKGFEISIDKDKVAKSNTKIFIAGGNMKDDKLVTSGGRVLAASSIGATFEEAWENSYKALKSVSFTDMFYRKDIGLPGAAESL